MNKPLRMMLGAALTAIALAASAQTVVSDAWVRGTVPAQKSTGLFARITSTAGGKLVQARSPAAGIVEIHEMSMEGDVMKMRAVDTVELPPGKAVEFKPGGLHVMLMDLKQPMQAGDSVALTLVIEGRDGKRSEVQVKAPVRSLDGH